MIDKRYREYFDIDEEYFPQINDSSIAAAAPDFWMRTYPHSTFIDMLSKVERVLAREEKRSIWIEGAYGTGKSQCAYALKKILEVPEADLHTYWGKYEPLKTKSDLLEKLIGHKQKGILTAYRYASGAIRTPRDLFFAVQETLRAELLSANLYTGENSLKESVIAWIDRPANKNWLDELLLEPKYASMFSQSSADEILAALRKGGEVKNLMENIFRLADNEGVTALTIDADRLIAWLTDVIETNKIKIVFIWDEFSDYFKNNRESLSEFQKLAEFVNLKPFYFIIVTHEAGQLFTTADTTWTKVRDRFVPVNIFLPDNIAFDLIGHAFNVKPVAQQDWDLLVDGDLSAQTGSARAAVMKEARITNPQVMKDIMPIHPMAALILKNIASAFQSNQRSMFDFIKSTTSDNVQAFQWFIENTGPFDDHPLLTVDMLWNFFYERGRDNLAHSIRLILDTYQQQDALRDDEKTVLKAILIMQAIDQQLGGTIPLFKATEQNLSYVFEGISSLDGMKSANIAKGLKDKRILIATPIDGGCYVYAAAVLAGDQTKIENHKKHILDNSTTAKLVAEGGLSTVLSLPPPHRLRFESEPGTGKIHPVTSQDFTRTINILRDKSAGWNFHAVIALAKDEAEAVTFRKVVKAAAADIQYENIVFIDALSTPLGLEAFDSYVDHAAMAMYYQGNQTNSSRESADKAKRVLDQGWKNRIYNGQFIIYTYKNQEGEKVGNGQAVSSVLQAFVTDKEHCKYVFDFARGLTENQLKLTQARQSAKCGIIRATSGVVVGIEKHIVSDVWKVDDYWTQPSTQSLPISKIKLSVDKLIQDSFDIDGQIAIGDIYDFLVSKYGFSPSNLSAFLAGFILKEYGSEPFRYTDSSGKHEPMTPDKLAEMLGNYIGKSPKPTYIVKMTPQEMAFYELTEKGWDITPNSCSSAGQAAMAVARKMREFELPVWCLEAVDTYGIYDIVKMYIAFVQSEGSAAHNIAIEIGRMGIEKPDISNQMHELLTVESCRNGMSQFLQTFDDGKIISLATKIGATNNVIADIRNLFKVKHSCLWDKEIGMGEIRKLYVEYGIARESNIILNSSARSLEEACTRWRERLRFISISGEALKSEYPSLAKIIDSLLRICRQTDLLPEQLKAFHADLEANKSLLKDLLDNDRRVFAKVYAPYLEELSDSDIAEIKSSLPSNMFELSRTDSNIRVKSAAEEYMKGQLKAQLFSLWRQKTGTKNPLEWSNRYKVPILCCVPDIEFEPAKKAFETLNRSGGTDAEIRFALEFIEKTSMFEALSDGDKRDAAFMRDVVGEYATLLPDIGSIRDALGRLTIETYEWRDSPVVRKRIARLAEAEYNAGGSDKVLSKIDRMGDAELKQYLKRLVKGSVTVGLEILSNKGVTEDEG